MHFWGPQNIKRPSLGDTFFTPFSKIIFCLALALLPFATCFGDKKSNLHWFLPSRSPSGDDDIIAQPWKIDFGSFSRELCAKRAKTEPYIGEDRMPKKNSELLHFDSTAIENWNHLFNYTDDTASVCTITPYIFRTLAFPELYLSWWKHFQVIRDIGTNKDRCGYQYM